MFCNSSTYLHVVEIVKLHGRGEIQEHYGEVRTSGGQLVQYGVGDELHGQLNVAEGGCEPMAKTQQKYSKNCYKLLKLCEWEIMQLDNISNSWN